MGVSDWDLEKLSDKPGKSDKRRLKPEFRVYAQFFKEAALLIVHRGFI